MLGVDSVEEVNAFATGNLCPDLTLYLDVDYETSVARRAASGEEPDRLERNPREFFEAVRAAYWELCARYPERLLRIDARAGSDEIFSQVRAAIQARLPN